MAGGTNGRTVRIGGAPVSYETEAAAGIMLGDGERWWGTRVRWRFGTAGRWNGLLAVDVHPMDASAVEEVLRVAVERAQSRRVPAAARRPSSGAARAR